MRSLVFPVPKLLFPRGESMVLLSLCLPLIFLFIHRGEFVEGTNNRLVTIVGSPACAQTAHTLIIHKLKQSMDD